MKKLCLITICLFVAVVGVNAQTPCPDGSVCVKQTVLDKCADVADQLKAAKDVIVQLTNERSLSIAERNAAQALVKGLNDYLAIKDRIIADYEHVNALLQKALDTAMNLVEKVMAKLDAPRSGWQKFVAALKEIAYLVTGIAIGRHF